MHPREKLLLSPNRNWEYETPGSEKVSKAKILFEVKRVLISD